LTQLELLSTEESLITIDASVAASDAALIQDQIALIKDTRRRSGADGRKLDRTVQQLDLAVSQEPP